MNINRHNYEEYFILYMDNELNPEEQQQVDMFVQHNPDLKEELEILLQSKFFPEPHITFENKDELLRTTEDVKINLSNYDEWLMRYVDNELNPEESTTVESFAALHPSVKKELEYFTKTKLLPEENIVFPDKELLYRKTERVRIIQMRWWKVAAAAMLILGIGTGIVFIMSNRKNPVNEPTASQKIKQDNNINNPITIQKNTIDKADGTLADNGNKIEKENQSSKQEAVKAVISKSENNKPAIQKNILPQLTESLTKDAPLIAESIATNNLPSSVKNPNVAILNLSSVPDINIDNAKNNLTAYQPENTSVTNQTSKPYINTVAVEESEARFASQGENDNKKTRGFFRKVTRLFEKTTKINPANDDDRMLIGALAVKLN